MGITSFYFFLLIGISLIVYYILPLRIRWITFMIAGSYFIYKNNTKRAVIVMIAMIFLAYFFGTIIEKGHHKKIWLMICVIAETSLLLALKEAVFFNHFTIIFGKSIPVELLGSFAPLGMSYFTLSLISYVLEIYWGAQEAQKNPLKFFTYASFFPALTSGPIMKYNDTGKQIIQGNKFLYENICFGAQRILWGFFKKIVIAERLSVLVTKIYADTSTYPGLYIWIATAAFVLQLYCDFSGCIDIIMGVSEMFGIKLPENFSTPFAAVSISEFWRRWHVTLGTWLREYIFYPILKTDFFQKIGAVSKKRFGKKFGKKIPVWMGLFITWFLIGLWHGGSFNYIWGVGIWFWIIIVMGELLEPVFSIIIKRLNICTNCFSWKLFQKVRTFLIFMIGLAAFRAGNWENTKLIYAGAVSKINPWIMWNGSFLELGLSAEDFCVLIFSISIICIAGIYRENNPDKTVRDWMGEQNLVFRWMIWILFFTYVIIWGKYGPGYSAAEFIYRGF